MKNSTASFFALSLLFQKIAPFARAFQILLLALAMLAPGRSFSQKAKPGVSIGHADKVVALDFSPNEKFAVSAGNDGLVKVWETKTGRLLKEWDPAPEKTGFSKFAACAAFLDENNILAAANGKPLQIWMFAASDSTGSVAPFTDPKVADEPVVRSFRLHPKKKEVLTLDDQNQLKIWNVKTRKPLLSLDAVGLGRITSFCFSADGAKVFAGTDMGQVFTWDASKGKPIGPPVKASGKAILTLETSAAQALVGTERALETSNAATPGSRTSALPVTFYSPGTGSVFPLRAAVFSPDGKWAAFGSTGQTTAAVIWDMEKNTPLHSFVDPLPKQKEGFVHALCFSQKGDLLLVGYGDGSILLWEVASGSLVQRLSGRPRPIKQIGFGDAQKAAFVVYGSDKGITIWDGKIGEEHALAGHQSDVLAAAFSPSGNFLLSSSEDGNLVKWDHQKGKVLSQTGPRTASTIAYLAISPNEKTALAITLSKSLEHWDLENMRPLPTPPHNQGKVTSVAFSTDGKYAFAANADNTLDVFDVSNNFRRETIPGQKARINPVGFSPDGKYAVSVSCNYSLIEVWDLQGKQLAKTFKTKDYPVLASHPFVCGPLGRPVFSPDSRHFLVPTTNGALLWDLDTGQPRALQGATDDIRTLAFAAQGNIALVGGADGTITLFGVDSGQALATIFQFDANEWAAITPEGLFDASPGALRKMYFTKDLETIDLEQLKDLYYEPDLLSILLGHKKGKLRNVGTLDDLMLYPEVQAGIKNNKLVIDLTERNGGIGKVTVFINGTEVIQDACGGSKNCPAIDLEQFSKHYFSKTEELENNLIIVVAYNREGWLKSPPVEVFPFPKAGKGGPGGGGLKGISFAPRPEPGIYAIVVGTSDYKESNIDLNFPDKDAAAIATSIQNISAPFFKGPKIVRQLTTDAADPADWPSLQNIRAAFGKVAKIANAEDVFFLFLSGHGITYTDGQVSDFYYLTMDCSDMNLAAADRRRNFCISTDTLTSWIKQIPAKKRVVVLDACHSGKAAENLFAGKSLTVSQERELERLKDRTGMFVLASSESGQKSWEDKNLKQGLLTYSILQGMAKTDGAVDVLELFNFARNHVPQLAEGIKEAQTPVLTVPTKEASSFPIGVVQPNTVIPIGKRSDFVAPCIFLDKSKMDDHLFLSNFMDEYLAEGGLTGWLGHLVFTKSPQKKDVFALRGLYEVSGNKVTLDGRLFQGGVEKAQFKATFDTTDGPAVLSKKINDAVNASTRLE